jgi:hypothetical protein
MTAEQPDASSIENVGLYLDFGPVRYILSV